MDWLTKRDWIRRFDPIWDGAVIKHKEFHFHRRLLERYGIVLGPGHYGAMMRQIRRKHAILIHADKMRGGAIYAVRVPGTTRIVFAAATNDRMITAVPATKAYLIRFHASKPEARAALMADV